MQQKTEQLQGIKTILSEADTLGLVVAAPHSLPVASTHESASELPATENGSPLPTIATEPVVAAIMARPTKNPSTQPHRQPGNVDSAEVSRDSQLSAAIKTSTAKAEQPKPSMPPASRVKQRGKASPLQPFLKSQWRDKALRAIL